MPSIEGSQFSSLACFAASRCAFCAFLARSPGVGAPVPAAMEISEAAFFYHPPCPGVKGCEVPGSRLSVVISPRLSGSV